MSIADISEDRFGGPLESRGPERTPPHDLLAEQSTLGGMLLSSDAVADVIERCAAPTSTCRSTS
jgi:replicative DNA helicase